MLTFVIYISLQKAEEDLLAEQERIKQREEKEERRRKRREERERRKLEKEAQSKADVS